MKRIILGILVAVFVFSVVGNCLAGAGSERKPTSKPTSTGGGGGADGT